MRETQLTLSSIGGFWTDISKYSERGFFDVFSKGASATKRFARSRIFKYWLPQDILSKGKKTRWGGVNKNQYYQKC